MIKTFADKRTKDLYERGRSKRFPPGIWERAFRKLEYLDLATNVSDLKVPPSNRLHKLEEAGLASIRFPSMISGGFAFGLKMAMRTTLR